jgi:NAD(P)H-dependent FMN reductase
MVRSWNHKVKEGDAYIVVTPEYNHSVSGVLKNALDNLFLSFALRDKPVAAVGYSSAIGGGVRAIEHLAQMVIEADAVPLRSSDPGEPAPPIKAAGLGHAERPPGPGSRPSRCA